MSSKEDKKAKKEEEKKRKEEEKKKKKEEKKGGKKKDDDDEDLFGSSDSEEDVAGGSKGGIGARMKKNIAGKVMTSSLGKKMIPPQLRGLLNGLKRIIARVENPKLAKEILKSMIKMIVKALLAIDRKAVSEQDLLKADEPLRKSFDVIVDLYDYYGDPITERMEAKFQLGATHMAKVGEIIISLMKPHIQQKTYNRIKLVFDTICKPDFLRKIWQSKDCGEDLEDLIDAMHKYTQFH